jgi:ArsR family transcriptional regulator, arsenate/arsenite/antimonite-responsive transcriptional repressor
VLQCCPPLSGAVGDDEASDLASVFGALADPARVRILATLLKDDACCVCDLLPELGVGQPTVSYHLKRLTDAGLLEREKRGTYAYYRLAPAALDRVRALFA